MNATLKSFLDRAEFDAIETAVRYYGGTACVEEFGAMTERLRELRELAADLGQADNGLFEFPRGAQAPTVAVGH